MIKVNEFKKIPAKAGIYTFKRGKTRLYIGKAANLKKRLSYYFRKNVGEKTRLLIKEATGLNWLETESEIDAILKEAEFIKKYRPKYNILMRDDKNYFYAGVTKETFPRIFITHQPRPIPALSGRGSLNEVERQNSAKYIGPFTSGTALKSVLKLLRRTFPYCTCKNTHKRLCLNAQIGRCLGCCCLHNVASIKRSLDRCNIRYLENIRNLVAVLHGRKTKLLHELRKKMREAAQHQDFEKAAQLRDQVAGLENIFGHRHVSGSRTSPTLRWNKIEDNIRTLLKTKKMISRVEGYDVSNISGAEATGSMVVFIEGAPAKSEYRKFKIKTVRQISDVAMLKEVLNRRLKHAEWPYPDLIFIDGGKPQLNALLSQLSAFSNQLSAGFKRQKAESRMLVAALAKREEELYIEGRKNPVPLKTLPPDTAFFFQRVRDEAHRFAKEYHLKRREINLRDD